MYRMLVEELMRIQNDLSSEVRNLSVRLKETLTKEQEAEMVEELSTFKTGIDKGHGSHTLFIYPENNSQFTVAVHYYVEVSKADEIAELEAKLAKLKAGAVHA